MSSDMFTTTAEAIREMSAEATRDFTYIMDLYRETIAKLTELKVGDPARLIYEMRYQILGFETITTIIEKIYSEDEGGEQ